MLNLANIHFEAAEPRSRSPRPQSLFTRSVRFAPVDRREDARLPEHYLFLLRRAGIEVFNYRSIALQRRMSACLRRLGASSLEEAVELVERRPARLNEVPGTVLLGVSRFFRDPAVWAAISEQVLPALLRDARSIRALSIGCSEGQELYSLAMLLAGGGKLESSLLVGLDCRQEAVRKARAGVYLDSALQETPREYHRFFEPHYSGVRIGPAVRPYAQFCRSSIFSFNDIEAWDLILFRNVAIYLAEPQGHRAWKAIAEALRPGGIVVTGTAERPDADLRLTRIAPCIYRKTRRAI